MTHCCKEILKIHYKFKYNYTVDQETQKQNEATHASYVSFLCADKNLMPDVSQIICLEASLQRGFDLFAVVTLT